MAWAKCRVCGSKINSIDAYLVITLDGKGNEKKAFYCNKDEYEKDLKKKEKAKADEDNAYYLICEIIGRKKIINTILWKEWKEWNKVATNEIIGKYLEENKSYLISVVSKLSDTEFLRIRYLSAILKNNLGDFTVRSKKEEPRKVVVEETFYVPTVTRNNKRRSLADLEDEF